MGVAKSKLTLFGFLLALLAGCSWDNSPPPYHSVITYDPSRAKTYVSTTNTPSTGKWTTAEEAGVYGYSGSTGPSAAAVGGAVSSPSGVSSGAATGTASPATGTASPAPASGTPGAIIGSPSGTSITTSPGTPTLPGPVTPAQPAPAPSSTLFTPAAPTQYPTTTTPSGIGLTNTSSGVIFTNRYTAPTNRFPTPGLNPGLTVPTP